MFSIQCDSVDTDYKLYFVNFIPEKLIVWLDADETRDQERALSTPK